MIVSSSNKSYVRFINEDDCRQIVDSYQPQLLGQYTSIYMYKAQITKLKCLGTKNIILPTLQHQRHKILCPFHQVLYAYSWRVKKRDNSAKFPGVSMRNKGPK